MGAAIELMIEWGDLSEKDCRLLLRGSHHCNMQIEADIFHMIQQHMKAGSIRLSGVEYRPPSRKEFIGGLII